jgi:hypothetical protein
LADLLCVRGSGAPSRARRTSTALALSIAGLLALSAGVAQAEPPRLVSYGTFGSVAQSPIGVAVDQPSGDVYVAGISSESGTPIDKFDASGKLISPPPPFGENFVAGAAAVNPTNGDLYVFNIFGANIETYDPNSGALVGTPFPVAVLGSPLERLLQIATDASGDVYVPEPLKETGSGSMVPNDEVHEYSPSGTLLNTFTGSGAGTLKEPTGVAVDSSGNLWVADHGNDRIEELSPADVPIGEIKSEGVRALALDGHGDVFAIVKNRADFCGSLVPPCSHLVEYSSGGAQVADVGAGSFEAGANFRLPPMVAVNDSSGRVYVTDASRGLVWIFGPPTAPVVDQEFAAEVTTSEAKLGALVNPGGIQTTYRFEYGTTTAYGQSTPFPEGSVGEGVTSHAVWAAASSLAPGTTYHYRVVATNELGTATGLDQTFTTETAAEASCPNEQLRSGFSASLPDCRAYEMVTPANSESAQPDTENTIGRPSGGGARGNFAARTGVRMSYRAVEVMPVPGARTNGVDYVATRGPSGWSSENVIPLQAYDGLECTAPGFAGDFVRAYSADLLRGIVRVGAGEVFGGGNAYPSAGCGAQGLEVVSGEPLGVENLLMRDNTTASYRLLNAPPTGVIPTNATFDGASGDLSHVIFHENAQLTANAPAGVEDLYEWDEGALRLVTVLRNGTPVVGSLAAQWEGRPSVISEDGTHVFFTAGGNLYVRVNGEQTVQLDETRGGSGPGGGGHFQGASAGGSQAFFTDDASAGLTSDTVPGSGMNLYRYANGQLTDLTSAEHAEVAAVSGVSQDGAYAYFVATAVLSGSQTNERGQAAQNGGPNLYLWHGGSTTFIATINDSEEALFGRVSPNGLFLAFVTDLSLTGFGHYSEMFLYSAASKHLVCASCNPSGEPPAKGGGVQASENRDGAPHILSNSGRVFFQTRDALLPRDTNGQMDVYEYEQGHLNLISSGTSSTESLFLDASESGDDVFFLSRQSLVPQDSSTEALVIYDARVNGGFAAISSPPACTTADACRTPVSPQPSLYGAPSSQTFSGAGNITPPSPAKVTKKTVKCKRGFVRKHNKCVKQKKAKKAKRASNHRRPGR